MQSLGLILYLALAWCNKAWCKFIVNTFYSQALCELLQKLPVSLQKWISIKIFIDLKTTGSMQLKFVTSWWNPELTQVWGTFGCVFPYFLAHCLNITWVCEKTGVHRENPLRAITLPCWLISPNFSLETPSIKNILNKNFGLICSLTFICPGIFPRCFTPLLLQLS